MKLFDFVYALFDNIKVKKVSGIFIPVSGGIAKVDIVPNDSQVIVYMDDIKMGYFEKVDYRGYEYVFHQQYRIGIQRCPTENEKAMKNICEMHDIIDFHSA